jgi:hypothetical protein
MPGFNGTGPAGRGPGTGGGFGPCRTNYFQPGRARGGGYYGRGAGWGAGFGPCRWWVGSQSPEDEKAFLNDQAVQLKAELAGLEQRIADLEQG